MSFDLLVHLGVARRAYAIANDSLSRAVRPRLRRCDRILDVRISQLRKKLGETDSSERIKTVWGHGYLFVPDAW